MELYRIRAATLVPALAGVALLAGCGAYNGVVATTSTPAPPTVLPTGGASTSVGNLVIDDVYVQGRTGLAAGATATVRLALDNEATTPDSLVGVSSPTASGARLEVDGKPVNSIPLPAGGLTDLEYQTGVQLTGLRKPLHPGEWLPITLRFGHAGPVTMTITVGPIGAATPGVVPPAA